MSINSLPIELIENILRQSTGSQLILSSRVATIWLEAKQNIERTDDSFWEKKCREEIEWSLIEELTPNRKPLDLLTGDECKELYIRWFRTQRVNKLPKEVFPFGESFGSAINGFENITSLTVTGNLVIVGHRSGKVHLIDAMNGVKTEIAKMETSVNDLVAINLTDKDRYENHKIKGYPTAHPSYSAHHHVVCISEGSRIYISLIADRHKCRPFEIFPLKERHYLKGRVCRDLLAVSTKKAVDISLFRLWLPEEGVVRVGNNSIRVVLLTTVSCLSLFNSPYHWLGLFSFSDLKLNVFCHEFNVIATSDVELNLSDEKKSFNWKWNAINEVIYEFQSDGSEEYYDLNVKILNGFSFGDNIFFLITSYNEIVYTTDAKTFYLCQLNRWIQTYDKIMSICLFGSVLACGTNDGYVYVHAVPTLKRLQSITHYKPLYSAKLCKEAILRISITDSSLGPVLAAATKHRVHLVKWTPNEWIKSDDKSVEVINLD